MKSAQALASLALALAAAFGAAQGFSQTSASAGSVAARSASGSWAGLAGSASRATLAYTLDGANVTPPNAFKFATTPSGVQAKTLPGFASIGPDFYASSHGASAVSTPGSDAPAYYTVDWTSNLFVAQNGTGTSDSGTFDPFDVRYGDVSGLAGPSGGPVDLYFQAALRKNGYGGDTSLLGTATKAASYAFSLYVSDANDNRTDLLSVRYSTTNGLDIDFNAASGLDLYLLGTNAEDPSATPDARIAAGTAISTQAGADALLAPAFNPDGSLTRNLAFGVRRQLDVLPGGSPNDPLFAWHVDTTNRVSTVPEPASLAALGLGALGLLRRRRR